MAKGPAAWLPQIFGFGRAPILFGLIRALAVGARKPAGQAVLVPFMLTPSTDGCQLCRWRWRMDGRCRRRRRGLHFCIVM